MEDIDGELHPAVDGQRRDETRVIKTDHAKSLHRFSQNDVTLHLFVVVYCNNCSMFGFISIT